MEKLEIIPLMSLNGSFVSLGEAAELLVETYRAIFIDTGSSHFVFSTQIKVEFIIAEDIINV